LRSRSSISKRRGCHWSGYPQVQLFLKYLGLNTNLKEGIFGDEDDKNEREAFYGTNKKVDKEPPSFFKLLCEALEDFTLRILIVAAVITIIAETATAPASSRDTSWIEGSSILMAVAICATVTAANDYQK
jgi:magnesium-transporting ATPase (P-type)